MDGRYGDYSTNVCRVIGTASRVLPLAAIYCYWHCQSWPRLLLYFDACLTPAFCHLKKDKEHNILFQIHTIWLKSLAYPRRVISLFKWFLPVFATRRRRGEGIGVLWLYMTVPRSQGLWRSNAITRCSRTWVFYWTTLLCPTFLPNTGCERYWRPFLKVVYCPSRQHNFDVILSKDSFLPLLSNSSVFLPSTINRMLQEVMKEPLSQGFAPGGPTGRWLTSTTSPATLWRILLWCTSIFMKKVHYEEFNIKRKYFWAALRPQ